MNTKTLQRYLSLVFRWIFALLIIWLIWEYLLLPHISPTFFTSPRGVATELRLWFDNGTLGSIIRITLSESLTGFGIGIGIGLVVGLIVGLAPLLIGKLIEPVVIAVYAMPKLVLTPMLFIWFGSGFLSVVVIVVMAVFPVVAIYTVSGVRTLDGDMARMMQLYGASKKQIGQKLLLPHAMGYVVTSLLFAAPHAISIAIGAEILFGSTNGIGGVLNTSANSFDAHGVLAALVVGTIASVLIIKVTNIVGNRLLHTGESARRSGRLTTPIRPLQSN